MALPTGAVVDWRWLAQQRGMLRFRTFPSIEFFLSGKY
jgi:hypothetical protein